MSKDPFSPSGVLCWENPGPQRLEEFTLQEAYRNFNFEWKWWPETIQACREGLGELSENEGECYSKDGPIDEWIFGEDIRWSALAEVGSKYHEILEEVVDGVPEDDETVRSRLSDELRTATLAVTAATVKWTGSIEHDLRIARTLERDFRHDSVDTFDVCREERYGEIFLDTSATDLIHEAETAGFRLIIENTLAAPIKRSGNSDFGWLYDLHFMLVDEIDKSACFANLHGLSAQWRHDDRAIVGETTSLFGYDDREIIRLALPLLRWGEISSRVRGSSKKGEELYPALKHLPPCDSTTWSEFSNAFCSCEQPERFLDFAESRILYKVITRFVERAFLLGYKIPLPELSIESLSATRVREILNDLHLKGCSSQNFPIQDESEQAEILNRLQSAQNAEDNGSDRESTKHSEDFRSVVWFGEKYTFTAIQAACIKVLWEAWKNGTSVISGDTIIAESESLSRYLSDVFKKHPAWKTMITSPQRGSYCLSPPE